ncbi:TPA: hypothetical protein ACK3RK_005067 [Burkholderia cepacia]
MDTIKIQNTDSRKTEFGKMSLIRATARLKKAVLTKRKAKTAMGITVAELRGKEIEEPYEVKIFLGPLKSWQISLITQSGKTIDVETKRSAPKTWRYFEDAVEFATSNCQEALRMQVQIGEILLKQ